MNEVSTAGASSAAVQIEKGARWVRVAAVAGCVGILAIAAPIIWAAASAAAGLLMLGVTVLVVGALTQAVPYLGQRWENKLLQARKAEARRNPIEQMQNTFAYRAKQLDAFKDALKSIGGQIKGMQDMLDEQRKKSAGHDLSKQQAAVEKMQVFYDQQLAKLKRANTALEEYRRLIEQKIFEWNFAQRGKQALASMNATDQESILKEILADEALRSVQDNFNEVFADLDIEARTMTQTNRLEFGGDMSLDIEAIEVPSPVPVSFKESK